MVDANSMSSSQVEWNMANLLNMELSKLRSNANTYFISGKYREAIDTLIVMKMTGVHAFSKEERDKLNEIEAKLFPSMIHLSTISSFNKKERQKAMNDIIMIKWLFPKYNEVLMDTLHSHGFLGQFRKDAGRMRI